MVWNLLPIIALLEARQGVSSTNTIDPQREKNHPGKYPRDNKCPFPAMTN